MTEDEIMTRIADYAAACVANRPALERELGGKLREELRAYVEEAATRVAKVEAKPPSGCEEFWKTDESFIWIHGDFRITYDEDLPDCAWIQGRVPLAVLESFCARARDVLGEREEKP